MTNATVLNALLRPSPEVTVLSTGECPDENRIILNIEFEPAEQVCPECSSHHCRPDVFCKVRTIRHLPVANQPLFLRYTPRHFVW